MVRRALGLGNYWYWYTADDLRNGIEIAAVVCPLRYDVLIRRDFLAFYAAHRELYARDMPAFVALAKQQTYYRWYTESEVVRCQPERIRNQAALEAGFVERVQRAAQLYEHMIRDGFDPDHPVILKTAERLLPPTADRRAPPTGKLIARRYFLADGCHRVAMLLLRGDTMLRPGYFRVKCFREFSPFDSTSLLVRSLPLNTEAYFRFLSTYYSSPFVFEDRYTFLDYIRQHRPEVLEEVLTVIEADGFASL